MYLVEFIIEKAFQISYSFEFMLKPGFDPDEC